MSDFVYVLVKVVMYILFLGLSGAFCNFAYITGMSPGLYLHKKPDPKSFGNRIWAAFLWAFFLVCAGIVFYFMFFVL